MNGFVRKIAAAALAAAISVGAALSASAQSCVTAPEVKVVELDSLGDGMGYHGYPDFGIQVLLKNMTVKKNPLYVRPGDTACSELVIPKGKKLTLKKGAIIDGDMYIEKGASVAVSGGTLKVSGNLVCDGTLSIGEKAGLSLTAESRFVINTTGTLRYNADGISISPDADVACFGKLKYKYLSDEEAGLISAKPVCMLVQADDYGRLEMVTDEKSMSGYVSGLTDYGYGNPGTRSDNLYFIMGNGSKIRVVSASDKISNIAGVNILKIRKLTDEALDRKSTIS